MVSVSGLLLCGIWFGFAVAAVVAAAAAAALVVVVVVVVAAAAVVVAGVVVVVVVVLLLCCFLGVCVLSAAFLLFLGFCFWRPAEIWDRICDIVAYVNVFHACGCLIFSIFGFGR